MVKSVVLLSVVVIGLTSSPVWAQKEPAQNKIFVSDLDKSLSLTSIAVIPMVDNVSGVYAPVLTTTIFESLDSAHRWNVKTSSKNAIPEDLETNPKQVQALMKAQGVDGLIAGRVSKGPRGLYLKLGLYVGAEGLPVAFESLNNYEGFETADLKAQTKILLQKLLTKLPYQGQVLSRKGELITISMGSKAGLKQGLELTVTQVIKINRHPKFKFILGTDNLTLGKIRIEKVEDSLSFASVVSERTTGAIATGAKVSWDQFVSYHPMMETPDGKMMPAENGNSEAQAAFGDHPKEWTPEVAPTFGKVGFMFGLGSVSMNNSLATTTSSGSSSVAPSLHVNGEMWFTPNWFANARMDTWVFTVSNGYSGSTPNSLNVSARELVLNGGYNFLLDDDFYGPKFSVTMGYAQLSTAVDGSTPTAFESTTYSGLNLGLGGEFPIPVETWRFPLFIGGRLNYFLSPSLSETPTSSGAGSSSSMASFAATFNHRIRETVNVHAELDFDSMSSSFSGTGARTPIGNSSSQTLTTLAAGVEYLF
jgi:hypothetical protein